jgi:hypothetical protein
MTMRATVLAIAVVITQGCQPKQAEEEQIAESESEPANPPLDNGELLEACVLKVRAPEPREWKTYWDPRADGFVKEGPSSAGSPYWANDEERQKIPTTGVGAVPPLSIGCSAADQYGQSEIAISLDAYGASEQQVPFGPGTYPIIGRFGGEKKPGAFVANVIVGETLFDANGGTLTIERFDAQGVAGSFSVEGKDIVDGTRALQLEGTFDLPCRGGPMESRCSANKATRE